MKRLSEELESLTRAVQRHDAAKALRAVSRIFENANWTWARPPRGRTGEPPAEWAADLLTGLGYRLHSTGESRAGAEVYEAVLRLRGNDPVALSCLSGIAMGQGDLRKAARLLGKAKRAAPSHPIVLLVDGHLTARRGRPGEARERYLAALQHSTSDPDRQLALYSLAVLAERREDFQEAAGYLRQALSIDETDPYVLSHLAYAESRLGEAASAEAHYRQALEECDEFSEVWVSLGTLCLERDGAADAREAFARALELDDSDAEAHSGMAEAMVASDEYDTALPHALRAVELAPDSGYFGGHLGYVYELLEENDEAERWYRRALGLDGTWAWAWTKLGWRRYLAGDLGGAREAFAKALELDEADGDAHLGMAEVDRKLGDDEGSARHLERVVALEPGNPERLADLAFALASLSRHEEAVEKVSQALALDDRRASVWAKVGWVRLTSREIGGAKNAFQRALELDEENEHAHQGMAEVLSEEHHTGEALFHAERAVELNPTDPGCRLTLGDMLEETGRYEDAEAAFHRALELEPGSTLAHCALADVLIRQGRLEEAEAEYARAVGSQPTREEPRLLLARLLMSEGRLPEAREVLEMLDVRSVPREFRAAVLAAESSRDEARTALAAARETESEEDIDKFVLGLAYEKLGEQDMARACYEDAVKERDPLAKERLRALLSHGPG